MRCTSVHREFAVLSPVWVWADRMGKWPWWCSDWSQSRVPMFGLDVAVVVVVSVRVSVGVSVGVWTNSSTVSGAEMGCDSVAAGWLGVVVGLVFKQVLAGPESRPVCGPVVVCRRVGVAVA